MKREFAEIPGSFREQWPGEFSRFSWIDYLTAIPSPLFLITTYKGNGKPNACLQSWSTFVGDSGQFLCIIGSVSRTGHLYRTLGERGECVLNFPSADVYDRCTATIRNNEYDDDEITASGLTVEKAAAVDAPRIAECFLCLECEHLWEREHFAGSREVTVCLRVKHVAMDGDHCDEERAGRYGRTGYIYNIHSPRNPETGRTEGDSLGFLTPSTDSPE